MHGCAGEPLSSVALKVHAAILPAIALIASPGFADVPLVGPVVVVGELVLGEAQPLELLPHLLRHAGMVGERPQEPLLVAAVVGDDRIPPPGRDRPRA